MRKVDGVTAFKQGLTVKKQAKKRSSSSLQEWGVEEVREGGCLKGCSRKALYEIRPEHLEEIKWPPLPPCLPLSFFLSLVGLFRSRYRCTDPEAEEKLAKLEHGDWERGRKEPGGEGIDHIKWELASLGSMVQISIPSKAHVWRTKPQLATLLGVAKPLCLLWWSTQSTVSGPAWRGWGVVLLKGVCQWGWTLRLKAPAFFQVPLSASYLWWRIWALSILSSGYHMRLIPAFPVLIDSTSLEMTTQINSSFYNLPCLGQDALSQQTHPGMEAMLLETRLGWGYWDPSPFLFPLLLPGNQKVSSELCPRSHHMYSLATGPGAMYLPITGWNFPDKPLSWLFSGKFCHRWKVDK